MKGQWCSIFVSKFVGNCSNGGISTNEKRVFVIGIPEDKIRYPEDSDNVDSKFIVTIQSGHRGYRSLAPLNRPEGTIGPMAGGTVVQLDLKDGKEYLPLHDRFETPEMYNKLCQ